MQANRKFCMAVMVVFTSLWGCASHSNLSAHKPLMAQILRQQIPVMIWYQEGSYIETEEINDILSSGKVIGKIYPGERYIFDNWRRIDSGLKGVTARMADASVKCFAKETGLNLRHGYLHPDGTEKWMLKTKDSQSPLVSIPAVDSDFVLLIGFYPVDIIGTGKFSIRSAYVQYQLIDVKNSKLIWQYFCNPGKRRLVQKQKNTIVLSDLADILDTIACDCGDKATRHFKE